MTNLCLSSSTYYPQFNMGCVGNNNYAQLFIMDTTEGLKVMFNISYSFNNIYSIQPLKLENIIISDEQVPVALWRGVHSLGSSLEERKQLPSVPEHETDRVDKIASAWLESQECTTWEQCIINLLLLTCRPRSTKIGVFPPRS